MCKVTALTGENSGFGPERPGRWINGDYLMVIRITLRNDPWSFPVIKLKKVAPYVETNGRPTFRNDPGRSQT